MPTTIAIVNAQAQLCVELRLIAKTACIKEQRFVDWTVERLLRRGIFICDHNLTIQ
jgi:hypothetical protein